MNALKKPAEQDMNLHSPPSTAKKITVCVIAFSVLGALFSYMLWATRLSRQTVLMPWVPEWTIYLAITALVGLIFAGRTLLRRPAERTLKRLGDSFFSGACIGFVLSLNGFSVATYLLPSDTVQYTSGYEIAVPGPSLGRTNRCEAGVWIKDLKTERRIQLCTSTAELHTQLMPGMDAVWVTARTNAIGSYIAEYTFIYKQASSDGKGL